MSAPFSPPPAADSMLRVQLDEPGAAAATAAPSPQPGQHDDSQQHDSQHEQQEHRLTNHAAAHAADNDKAAGQSLLAAPGVAARPLSCSPSPSPPMDATAAAVAVAPVDDDDGVLDVVRTNKALGRRQLCAMLRKNWLLKRRAWCQSLCECFAPIFLTLLIVLGWQLSANSATTTDPTIYVNQTLDLAPFLSDPVALINLVNGGNTAGAAGGGASGLGGLGVGPLVSSFIQYAGPLPVPSLDTFITAHNLLHSYLVAGNDSTLESVNRLSIADARFNVLVNLGKLSFAPDTPEVRAVVAELNRTSTLFAGAFDRIWPSEADAVNYALRDFTLDPGFNDRDPYVLRSWAVIYFDDLTLGSATLPGSIDFTIRMNYSVIPSTKRLNKRFGKGYDDTYQRYFLSGFMTLQLAVEDAIVSVIGNSGSFAPSLGGAGGFRNQSSIRSDFANLMTAPMPVSSAYNNPFYDASGPFVGLVLCMSLLYPVSRLIKHLVEDKESRMKETLKMMGMFNWVFVSHYAITYLVVFTFIAFLQTLLLGATVMQHSAKGLLFVYFWFFGLSMMALSFLISVFFSRAKLAGIVGPILCFALVMPRYAFLTTEDDEQLGAKFVTCILSPTAFAFAMDVFMLYEGSQQGVTTANAAAEPVSVSAMIAFMFFDGVAYAFLAWFFEQTLPNEYGSHRRPWFLFQRSYWCTEGVAGRRGASEEDMAAAVVAADAHNASQPHNEPIRDPELRSKARLVVSHLQKVFSHGNALWNWITRAPPSSTTQVVAVRDLSLTMYEGQITCLLGHNGAGKSTTISMLTGLYPPTSGDAFINGFPISTQMEQIRHNLGICPQHNVLYPTLTVAEHLRLFAILKGTPAHVLDRCVADKIHEVGLQAKTNVFSQSLSGGMKRKLSVGMALIGDSKIVFLDEPTSGMDPYSRRSTWELLKRAKRGRVIVLTTHFMDEADLLGDRVAIIANGGLRACGSSLFLKNQFGIGYNLTLVYQRVASFAAPTSPKRLAGSGGAANGKSKALMPANGKVAHAGGAAGELQEPLLLADSEEHKQAAAASVSAVEPWSQSRVHAFIQQYVADAKQLTQAAGEISFQLPLSAVSQFSALFDALDASKDSMGIAAYGISMTTLEEVFVKIAHEESFRNKEAGGTYVRDQIEDAAEKRALEQKGAAALMVAPKRKKMVTKRRKKQAAAAAAGAVAVDASSALASPSPPFKSSVRDGGAEEMEMAEVGSLRLPSPEGTEVAASALSAPVAPSGVEGGSANANGAAHEDSEEEYEEEVSDDDEASPLENKNASGAVLPAAAAVAGATGVAGLVSGANEPRVRHVASMPIQVRELLRKRYLCAKRDLLGRFFEVVLPVGIVALVLLILTISFNPAGPEMIMGSNLYQVDPAWREPSAVQGPLTGPAPAAHEFHTAASVSRKLHDLPRSPRPSHREVNLAVGPTTIHYYPSYAVRTNDTFPPPSSADFGLTPVPVHGSRMDGALLYALGLPAGLSQPFLLDYYLQANSSLDLSVELLADVKTHAGRRVGSYVFDDTLRAFSPINSSTAALFLDALVGTSGILPPGFNGSTIAEIDIPLTFTDVDGVLQLESPLGNISDVLAFVDGSANVTNINLPGLNVSADILVQGGDLIVNLPTVNGADGLPLQLQFDLNALVRNFTERINGTDSFLIRGTNITVNAGPGLVADGVNSLNLTQLATALRDTFVNQTIPTIVIPIGALFGTLVDANSTAAFAQALLDGLGLGLRNEPVTLLHNVSEWHAIPGFAADLFRSKLALMYNEAVQSRELSSDPASYSTVMPAYAPRSSFTLRNHPLPLTTQSILTIRAILAIFAALFVLIPFCYLPASFVIFVVRERESKAKHLQLVSGVSPLSYWLSTYLFDLANYLCVCVAVICVFLAYQNESFTGDSATTAATFMLFVLYGFSVVPMAYLMSFLFTNHTAAQVGISSILFILGFVLTIGSFILQNIDTTRDINEALKPFYRISPPFCLGEGMINLATRSLTGLLTGRKASPWDWEVVGRVLIYMVVESVGFFLLTLAVEYQLIKKAWKIGRNKYQSIVGGADAANGLHRKQQRLNGVPIDELDSKQGMSNESQQRLFDRRTPSVSRNGPAEAAPAALEHSTSQRRISPRTAGLGVPLGVRDEEKSAASADAVNINVKPTAAASAPSDAMPTEDDDVLEERRRIQSGAADGDLIVLKHLRKSFGWDGVVSVPCTGRKLQLPFVSPPMVSVKDLSLSVPAGQCFGFLGINGAGKTTTMSLLTGELEADSGRAFLNGFDVATEQDQVRQELGYCPQFDPTLDLLTARDHLLLYGRVRGISEARLPVLVQALIDKLGLGPFADNISQTYSGGNKRKLSLAIALIGDPTVVFLDEPSTGMDPVSRRFMWEIISELSKSMSIVLTTHSMEECEALCSRVGIMVNGGLACLGSLEHLKQKYGKGYHIEINADAHRLDEIRSFVQELFPGAQETEHHAGRIKYLIAKPVSASASAPPRADGSPEPAPGGISLATIFSRIEAGKQRLGIHDYLVGGASLESIFVSIAKSQDHAQAEHRANHNDKREAKR